MGVYPCTSVNTTHDLDAHHQHGHPYPSTNQHGSPWNADTFAHANDHQDTNADVDAHGDVHDRSLSTDGYNRGALPRHRDTHPDIHAYINPDTNADDDNHADIHAYIDSDTDLDHDAHADIHAYIDPDADAHEHLYADTYVHADGRHVSAARAERDARRYAYLSVIAGRHDLPAEQTPRKGGRGPHQIARRLLWHR
jgi:hypothetical protein